jgi:hypothetical protein
VPTRDLVSTVEGYLNDHGIGAASVGPDGPRKPDVVHVGTLHRFRGLEYQQMIVAGAGAGVVPASRVLALRDTDPARYDRETKQVLPAVHFPWENGQSSCSSSNRRP